MKGGGVGGRVGNEIIKGWGVMYCTRTCTHTHIHKIFSSELNSLNN